METERVPPALRARARLAQGVALQDMRSRARRRGWLVSAPRQRLRLAGPALARDLLWQAACGGSQAERARAAQRLSLAAVLTRPGRP